MALENTEAIQAPARVENLHWRAAAGGDGAVLCEASLTRALTAAEVDWFENAGSWREPSPSMFLIRNGAAHFMCGASDKSHWLLTLEKYLGQAWEEA
ncbi:MAG: hypothetical protein ACRD3I_14455 [Terriglobales bacterium]